MVGSMSTVYINTFMCPDYCKLHMSSTHPLLRAFICCSDNTVFEFCMYVQVVTNCAEFLHIPRRSAWTSCCRHISLCKAPSKKKLCDVFTREQNLLEIGPPAISVSLYLNPALWVDVLTQGFFCHFNTVRSFVSQSCAQGGRLNAHLFRLHREGSIRLDPTSHQEVGIELVLKWLL